MQLYFKCQCCDTIVPIYDGKELSDKEIETLLIESAKQEGLIIKPYRRYWLDSLNSNRTICDFGSWSWYFIIER